MSTRRVPSPDTLRQAILDLREPVVFEGFLEDDDDNWRLLNLSNFTRWVGDKPLPFRVTQNARTPEPQWDLLCPVEIMKMSEFMEKIKNNLATQSYYFDYKYMHEWFESNLEVLEAVNWRRFGFDKSGKDSTLWLGSTGSHTNCHQDTYGCNLVAQLHGRKQWILFPPNAGSMLKQTRVPFEESTIYSQFNFFSPSTKDEESIMAIEHVKVVTLEPGQVLFVPPGWWHYVESLELTLSVNVWLEIDSDHEARLKEAVVQLIISRLGWEFPGVELLPSTASATTVVEKCIEACRVKEKAGSTIRPKKTRPTPWTVEDLVEEYPERIKKIDNFPRAELKQLLISKRERFATISNQCEMTASSETKSSDEIVKSIANVLLSPDVTAKIVDNLLEK